ncbi:hypothetical protein TUM4630_17090 [Shewanella algidipiscicola]|uniref:Uncharacterized protein n=1 Tax=Shewanella algidipiscicola TaxID=614070 RepID=A0ABQ4PGB8_9GAMM|nr:hypothetical protein TUM4630_17090 [Shewanella algidipiscicola]
MGVIYSVSLAGGAEQTTLSHNQARIIRPPRKAGVENRQGAFVLKNYSPSQVKVEAQVNIAQIVVNKLTHKMSGAFCSALAPV